MAAKGPNQLSPSSEMQVFDTSIPSDIDNGEDKGAKTDNVDACDLDECIKDIISWETSLLNLCSKTQELQEENKLLKGQVEMMKFNQNCDKTSISDLQETVKTLQDILTKRIDQEEELKILKEDLVLLKSKVEQTEDQLENEKQKNKDAHRMQQNIHATEILKLREKLDDEYLQKETELNETIDTLNVAVAAERENRKEMAKKHENDIVKMQMEYENKLALVQAQNSRLQSNTNSVNSGANEVFRKKLQHLQEESLREINRLKQEVTLLKLKLDTKLPNKDTSAALPSAGRPGILKRKRF